MAETTPDTPRETLVKICLEKNPGCIAKLGRIFRRLDYNNSDTIAEDEIKSVIQRFGVKFEEEQYKELFTPFYADNHGEVYFAEFTKSLRPAMSEKRIIAVMAVYNKLDASSQGFVDANELRKKCDPNQKAIINFLSTFEDKYVTDSRLSSDDFLNYYAGVSTTVRNDEEFSMMMKEEWLKKPTKRTGSESLPSFNRK